MAQPITAHWRGHSPLLWSILLNLLGLRLLVGMIPAPDHPTVALLLIGASLLLLIWQVVGTIRAADRHFKHNADLLLYWLAQFSIAIAIALSTLHTFDLMAGPPATITLESLRTRPPPPISPDKTTVYLTGDLDFTSNQDLIDLLVKHPEITTVELHSNGGLVYAARAIAFNIAKYNIDTHVAHSCNSACPIAFMAGKQRTLEENGALGFHQYKLERLQPLQIKSIKAEQEKDSKYFLSRGVSPEFLKQLYQSEHDLIWQPDRELLLGAGIIHPMAEDKK
uniref:Clp protease n=1 Tax=uncultured Thiotrichaceae bacterium TaxID=298394 RepID=A0A6S6SPA0_9GAMM|nr:MAG: Unknown protein [uncultured Thiotrichaceae bacterium]